MWMLGLAGLSGLVEALLWAAAAAGRMPSRLLLASWLCFRFATSCRSRVTFMLATCKQQVVLAGSADHCKQTLLVGPHVTLCYREGHANKENTYTTCTLQLH
jgi:hypothetical protein